jgi:hypothetical protein
VSGPVLAPKGPEDLTPRKPAIMVFLSGSDGDNCCAANYERFVFRDQKVVKLAQQQFAVLRLDRKGTPKEVLERFKIDVSRPSLLVVDAHSQTYARWDTCANASDVYRAMMLCLKWSAKRVRVAAKQETMFLDAEKLLQQESYRAAGMLLNKIKRTRGGPQAAILRADRMLGEIAAVGRERYEHAMGLASATQRYDELLHLRHEFWFFEVIDDAKRAVVALEDGAETGPVIHNHNGLKLLAEAKALIEAGKDAKGRTILRKVRKDFAGTQAASEAESLLN